MSNDKRKVYVVGHKNPDTDSICTAIAYANLKTKLTQISSMASSNCFHRRRLPELLRNAACTDTEANNSAGIRLESRNTSRMTDSGAQMRAGANSTETGMPVSVST